MRYRDAGVDLERSDAIKQRFARAVRSTWGEGVRRLERGFAGVMEWPAGGGLLAATMDGVGTKLHLALAAGRADRAAADLVYHGANDLLVHGARPLAFLDYIAQERLDPETVAAVVEGLSRACREVGAALLGGETAEMPDTYRPGVIDVAGCMLGVVEEGRVLDGSAVRPGDRLLGLASSGLHTNGYSLARRVLADSGLTLRDPLPGGGETLADALLSPHRWYGMALAPAIAAGRVRALAHVTGGGIAGNLERVLPEGARARVDAARWPLPALQRWLVEAGGIPGADARRAFNLGIGMVVVTAPAECEGLARDLARAGETVFEIGDVQGGERGVEWVGSP
ncbi:MAG TPA: phosphoribosylformylglycinamidine cyclo-ligase [Candidatus Eisenbacteria bacterium]|jgi:phosphoribosylformylglycinamidine cyclo-ligase